MALRTFVHIAGASERYDVARIGRGRLPFPASTHLGRFEAIPGLTVVEVHTAFAAITRTSAFMNTFRNHLTTMAAADDVHFPPVAPRYQDSVLAPGTIVFVPKFGSDSGITSQRNGVAARLPLVTTSDGSLLYEYTKETIIATFKPPTDGSTEWVYRSPFLFLLFVKWFIGFAQSQADGDFGAELILDGLPFHHAFQLLIP
jgi:hypothetical protein